MSRLFDGVDDLMTYSHTGSPNLTGALTMLVVAKLANNDGWMSWIECETSGGGLGCALGRNPNTGNDIYMSNQSANVHAIAATDVTNWAVWAVTKTSGTTTPRMHKVIVGGAATHTDANSTLANPSSQANGNIRIGGNDDFANFRLAAAALWEGTALSDGNIETIASTATTQGILDLSPTWCVDDSDAFATDLVGSIDRTSITGTADDADDPSGWVYFGGGGGGVTVKRLSALGVG